MSTTEKPVRLLSLDAYRGAVMCLLTVNGFAVASTATRLGYGPNEDVETWSGVIWQTLGFHNSHPFWNSQFHFLGCSFWDLIQPAFMFMVGVAMPYSYASRLKRGDSNPKLTWHALWRAIVLTAIGFFLATRTTGWTTDRPFTNVLAQIGLGYFFVFLLMRLQWKTQVVGVAILSIAWTGLLLLWPAPTTLTESVIQDIESFYVSQSVGEHFVIHTNFQGWLDGKLLSAFFLDTDGKLHPAGYTTFNFVPAMITMLLGVLAAQVLRTEESPRRKLQQLIMMACICLVVGLLASVTVCPLVKKIWTPAWAFYSGGLVIAGLALMYYVVDILQWRKWTFPLVVVGMNSLAVYLMEMLCRRWIVTTSKTYVGKDLFSGDYAPMLQASVTFGVIWLAAFYLYRQRIFFRI